MCECASRKCDWENVGLCLVCGVVFCVHPAVHCVQCVQVHLCVRVAHRHRWWVCVQCLVFGVVCIVHHSWRVAHRWWGKWALPPPPPCSYSFNPTLRWSLSTFKENITNMREMFTNDPRLNTFSSATVAEMENTQTQRLRAVKFKYVQGRHCKGAKVPAKNLYRLIVKALRDNRTILQGHQLNSIWSKDVLLLNMHFICACAANTMLTLGKLTPYKTAYFSGVTGSIQDPIAVPGRMFLNSSRARV